MKKKKKWIIWVAVALIAALAIGWLLFVPKAATTAAYKKMEVTQGDLTTYYNFDGVVYAKKMQTISAGAPGIVKSVYVAQNQQVGKGDKLYKTEDGETVRADIAGEVTGLYVQPGDVLAAGEKTAEIIAMDDLEVRVNVDEYDVQAVVPGAAAEVAVLALDAAYPATVTALDKNGTASGDLSYYTARMDLEQSGGVYPGMQVSAKMLRAKAEGAAILKIGAIQFDEYNKPFVYVPAGEGEEPAKVQVTVGVSDGVNCEILSGVSAGDTVLVPSGMTAAQMMQLMRENNPLLK